MILQLYRSPKSLEKIADNFYGKRYICCMNYSRTLIQTGSDSLSNICVWNVFFYNCNTCFVTYNYLFKENKLLTYLFTKHVVSEQTSSTCYQHYHLNDIIDIHLTRMHHGVKSHEKKTKRYINNMVRKQVLRKTAIWLFHVMIKS